MKFAIITHVNHIKNDEEYFGYGPYIREMDIWLKYIDEVFVVAPLLKDKSTAIDAAYKHHKINFKTVPSFNFVGVKNIFSALFKMPIIFWKIFWAMYYADHIHLRCPGNMGLVGCFVQILFPNKKKTAKYAGNWDPKSKQPWTYRLQKYILNNTFLTRNMQVLVYGEWLNQSKNIKSFFTATYLESERTEVQKSSFDEDIKFVFVGTLVVGKNPLYAVKLVEKLVKIGRKVTLQLFGEGSDRKLLENYIENNKLEEVIILKGNQEKETIKKAYKESHFVILPSKSEGWPKAIAEGMFFGAVPISTQVSCVPYMLDFGKRGILLEMNLEKDSEQIIKIVESEEKFQEKSIQALQWSQRYTTDLFESEIKKLLV